MTSSTALTNAPPSGMRDFLPQETALRDWATALLLKTYHKFGYTRIETPALENIAQLKRGEGGENLSLIFEVLKRGDKLEKVLSASPVNSSELADLGLRFDLTVPLVRFYAHNQSNLPNPFKSIQIGSVWRAESAQQGRFRQFTQCDIDIFGVKSEIAELELIQATAEALLALQFENFTIRLNDRRLLTAMAESFGFTAEHFENLFIQIDKLDKIGVAGVERELLAKGHAPDAVQKLSAFLTERQERQAGQTGLNAENFSLPFSVEESVIASIQNVLNAIKAVANGRYKIELDPTLVRGMGYYTGQIFEIVAEGYPHSIAGGGRYDKMVGKMSGRDVPACGFSIGFERIISILSERMANNKNFRPWGSVEKIALIFEPERDSMDKVLLAAKAMRDAQRDPVQDRVAADRMAGDRTANNSAESLVAVSIHARKKDMRKQIDALIADSYTGYAMYKSEASQQEIKRFAASE